MKSTKAAFTIIELMLATVVGGIVLMAAGAMLVGIMRQRGTFEDYALLAADAEVIEKSLRLTVRNALGSGLVVESDTSLQASTTVQGTVNIYSDFDRTSGGVRFYNLYCGDRLLSSNVTAFGVENKAFSRSGVTVSYTVQDPDRPNNQVERQFYVCTRNRDVGSGTTVAAYGLPPIEEAFD